MAAFVMELAFIYMQLKANSVKVKKCGGKRRTEESGKWFDFLYLSHSMICNAGIGLFAVHELPTRTLIFYYCSELIWCSGLKLSYDEHTVIDLPDEFREEWKSGRTSSGTDHEKKLSRLLKVGKRSIDSCESESFEALENKPKWKFSVEDESSVTMGEGEEDDDAQRFSHTQKFLVE